MPTYECDDFRVTFARVGSLDSPAAEYSIDAEYAGGRTVRSTFRLPMSATRLEQFVVQIARSGTREIAPDQIELVHADAETLGRELGDALFDDVIGPRYVDAQQLAAASGKGVRLTLSLGSTPELLGVPWELLYRQPRFLASQRHTPVVRYLEVGNVLPPLPIDGPVRVLGVVASPQGLTPLDVADERARVEEALRAMTERGLVELEWCDPATRRSLRQCLRDGTFHILHFVGHSDFDANGDGAIYLLDADGGPDAVNDAVLTALLGDQTSLRLVVLNSCKGARTTLTDPFSGIATSLVALGLPAVVAMQFSISDEAAIVFAEELFTSLIGRQYPIDAAVSEARKAVFAEVSEIEWATPVLFLRTFDGRLFEFTAAPSPIPLKVAPLPVIVVDEADTPTDTGATTGDPQPPPPQPPPPPPPQPPPQPRRLQSPPRAPESAPARRPVLIGAVLVVLAASIGAVVWFLGRDEAQSANEPLDVVPTATGQGVTPATNTPAASTLATAPAATCGGQPVPLRPPLTGLAPEFDEPFAAAQHWIDLVASARPQTDNSAVLAEITAAFPTGPIQSSNGLDGFTNMEASHLLPVAATAGDSSTTLDVAALVYDNATTRSRCRTGFLCSRYTVGSDGVITGFEFTAAPPMTSDDLYVEDVWFASTDLSPFADRLTVGDWFRAACARTAGS